MLNVIVIINVVAQVYYVNIVLQHQLVKVVTNSVEKVIFTVICHAYGVQLLLVSLNVS